MKRIQLLSVLCLPSVFALSGCGEITLGPRTETNVIFVKHKGIAARVIENKTVKVKVEANGKTYTQKIDIGGFYIMSPDVADEQKNLKGE
jgi:hypothetical protein